MGSTRIVTSDFGDLDIPTDVSLPEFLLQEISKYGDRLAFVDDATGKVVTYNEFVGVCRKLAAGLHREGLRKGDVVLVLAKNTSEYPALFMGITLCGGIVTGLEQDDTLYRLKRAIENADPSFVVFSMSAWGKIGDFVRTNCPSLKKTIIIEEQSGDHITYDELLQCTDGLPEIAIDSKKDIACILYTSGTTGDRKGTLKSHYSYIAMCLQCTMGATESLAPKKQDGVDVALMARSMVHLSGQFMYVTVGLYKGFTIVRLENYGLEEQLKAIEKYKVTIWLSGPLECSQLLKHPALPHYNTCSIQLIILGGTNVSKALREECARKIIAPVSMYGTTETNIVCSSNDIDDWNIGKMFANCEAKIVDITTSKDLGPGDQGEILLRTPGMFSGYYKRPDLMDEVMTEDCWYRTGDLGYYDEEGILYVLSRVKEMINYDAAKIPPAEVEAVILSLPGVDVAAVVGVPDPVYYELPRAYVLKRKGHEVTENEIHKIVQEKLGDYRKLRGGIVFVDDLPVTDFGKVNRKMLRQQAVDEINQKTRDSSE